MGPLLSFGSCVHSEPCYGIALRSPKVDSNEFWKKKPTTKNDYHWVRHSMLWNILFYWIADFSREFLIRRDSPRGIGWACIASVNGAASVHMCIYEPSASNITYQLYIAGRTGRYSYLYLVPLSLTVILYRYLVPCLLYSSYSTSLHHRLWTL